MSAEGNLMENDKNESQVNRIKINHTKNFSMQIKNNNSNLINNHNNSRDESKD